MIVYLLEERPIGILKGPTKSVRIIESLNYRSSNYGGPTVALLEHTASLTLKCLIIGELNKWGAWKYF